MRIRTRSKYRYYPISEAFIYVICVKNVHKSISRIRLIVIQVFTSELFRKYNVHFFSEILKQF